MNYVFFGTPEFAAIILERLIKAGFAPRLVICNPDRPVGRKKIITPPPAKVIAQKNGIKVYQPEGLEAPHQNPEGVRRSGPRGAGKFGAGQVRNLELEIGEADFAVLAAYGKILPKEIISMPKSGTLVVHPSLLPHFRGTTPIQNAILAGDKVTGTSIILADEKADHGPIVAGKELEIKENDTYGDLLGRLADLSAELLIKTIPGWLAGKITPQVQNENYATYTKKFEAEDAFIDPEDLRAAQDGTSPSKAEIIERKIRALNPEPGTWTKITPEAASLIRANKGYIGNIGKRMKILETELNPPTGGGKLVLKRIQFEGGKPQTL